jgi:hypothetical protein
LTEQIEVVWASDSWLMKLVPRSLLSLQLVVGYYVVSTQLLAWDLMLMLAADIIFTCNIVNPTPDQAPIPDVNPDPILNPDPQLHVQTKLLNWKNSSVHFRLGIRLKLLSPFTLHL